MVMCCRQLRPTSHTATISYIKIIIMIYEIAAEKRATNNWWTLWVSEWDALHRTLFRISALLSTVSGRRFFPRTQHSDSTCVPLVRHSFILPDLSYSHIKYVARECIQFGAAHPKWGTQRVIWNVCRSNCKRISPYCTSTRRTFQHNNWWRRVHEVLRQGRLYLLPEWNGADQEQASNDECVLPGLVTIESKAMGGRRRWSLTPRETRGSGCDSRAAAVRKSLEEAMEIEEKKRGRCGCG